MSDGAATCKQDKAKVSSLLGWRAHRITMVETQYFSNKMINPFARQGAPFK